MIIANVINVINYCNIVILCFPKSNIINKYYDRQPPKANINYENCSKLISAIVAPADDIFAHADDYSVTVLFPHSRALAANIG